jgi:hypothetical protein
MAGFNDQELNNTFKAITSFPRILLCKMPKLYNFLDPSLLRLQEIRCRESTIKYPYHVSGVGAECSQAVIQSLYTVPGRHPLLGHRMDQSIY